MAYFFLKSGQLWTRITRNWLEVPTNISASRSRGQSQLSNGVRHAYGEFFYKKPGNRESVFPLLFCFFPLLFSSGTNSPTSSSFLFSIRIFSSDFREEKRGRKARLWFFQTMAFQWKSGATISSYSYLSENGLKSKGITGLDLGESKTERCWRMVGLIWASVWNITRGWKNWNSDSNWIDGGQRKALWSPRLVSFSCSWLVCKERSRENWHLSGHGEKYRHLL